MPSTKNHRPYLINIFCLLLLSFALFYYSRAFSALQFWQLLLEISQKSILLPVYLLVSGIILGSVSLWNCIYVWKGDSKAGKTSLIFFVLAFFLNLIEKGMAWIWIGNAQENMLFLLILWGMLFAFGWIVYRAPPVREFFHHQQQERIQQKDTLKQVMSDE